MFCSPTRTTKPSARQKQEKSASEEVKGGQTDRQRAPESRHATASFREENARLQTEQTSESLQMSA